MLEIESIDDPRIADYRHVAEPDWLERQGLFVAEGRLVVRTLATSSRFRFRSALVSPTALESLSDVFKQLDAATPIYVTSLERLREIVGFNIHRGCLALGVRPTIPSVRDPDAAIPDGNRLVVLLEAVGNADNMGGIFRNALAFGADRVLLNAQCCDPLYRKAIRVSIGATLRVPFASMAVLPEATIARLKAIGLTVIGLTPSPDAMPIDDAVQVVRDGVALLFGSEEAGLSQRLLDLCDLRVRIPMQPTIDSLNVATASGIALHRFGRVQEECGM